jgi:hypothetical protein
VKRHRALRATSRVSRLFKGRTYGLRAADEKCSWRVRLS